MLALPLGQREVMLLRDVEGLSAEETAAALGLEPAGVKSRLHRARLAVRAHLATILSSPGPTEAPCPALALELSAYAAAELDQPLCAHIEAHLAGCSRCAAVCDTLRRTVALCGKLPAGEIPAPVRAAVWRAVRAHA